MQEEYKDRIAQLEAREMNLVGKLRETTQRQRSAYQNLDRIVHQGYNYYFQSLEEKKQM